MEIIAKNLNLLIILKDGELKISKPDLFFEFIKSLIKNMIPFPYGLLVKVFSNFLIFFDIFSI